ncbi:MAG: hypothetical protein COV29_02245 [Candidatus Yanofskybacteria bacterium CG10_big_fil_rev_8_21_14_0_10_36_16]|uniref:Glycosyl transferase family 1 domain-containing protein n=1 Tax=Candidatus Yanofskybacteria bacterium CG10_big_fil_rev_8_21_14_0_10_36_16 TaxID=1975096 RepID=A0A2J0Q7L7_9BACT|nr:MAG: hypothetical protein COV29_02245 [Candidatus Yanofskybacteria bacterium CG10_big_fil_rev_8_21_14_0_10_36_16]
MKLLMISGDRSLALGKRGAFYNTLEEFSKYWDRIDIVCPRVVSYQLPATSYQPFGNVFVHPSPWPLWRQLEWILKKGKELYAEHNFNLMTVHEYAPFYNGIGARLLHNKIKVPYVLEIHHVPGYPKAAGPKERIYRWATEQFIKHDALKVKAVRVVNKKQVPNFLIHAGVPEEKIKYIPSLYIDLDVFKPIPDVEKKYDVIFAGRLEENKNVDLLLRAVKLLVEKHHTNAGCLIIGEGPEKEYLKLRSVSQNIKVDFAGWLPTLKDVAMAYNSAKIFVNPSLNEGGPRVVVEAMACGLPVITTRVGITEDIIEDGSNGFIVDWSPDDIAEKVKQLLESDSLRNDVSKKAIETSRRFEKGSAIKNYADNLKSLIE